MQLATISSAEFKMVSHCLLIKHQDFGFYNSVDLNDYTFIVILRLSEQTIPAELEKSPPDYHAVADFLQDNFDGLEVYAPLIHNTLCVIS